MEPAAIEGVLAYHRRTKHHPRRYAASPGGLDWATQPDPFRTYSGAERIVLPLTAEGLEASYADLHRPGAVTAAPLDGAGIARLFELSLGLSAWKEFRGARWALRCNPSSGNLHPTEGYVAVPETPGLPAGVYHYVSRDHCLERRCAPDAAASGRLAALLPEGCFLVGLASIHWREAWKYGERAFRYCQHDVGHAVAAVRYAAAALGWSARLLPDAPDEAVAGVLGLDRPESVADIIDLEHEHPDTLLLVGPSAGTESMPAEWSTALFQLAEALSGSVWMGRANELSPAHVRWSVIQEVAEATCQDRTAAASVPRTSVRSAGGTSAEQSPLSQVVGVDANRASPSDALRAVRLIKQRRSGVDFDGQTSLPAASFYGMLDRLLPRHGVPPWDVWPWRPHVHCVLFVHRVPGVPAGLYLFERDRAAHARLQAALRSDFAWRRPAGCPERLPFYVLAEGDLREEARNVSCHQEIAADGAFSLGMIAEFADSLRSRGAWWYRRLFWEAGILGQALYLEAEAAGVRGTGIGCYFDDLFHTLLGLRDESLQSLYHFTVGGAVDDPRLTTLPPYAHLRTAR